MYKNKEINASIFNYFLFFKFTFLIFASLWQNKKIYLRM